MTSLLNKLSLTWKQHRTDTKGEFRISVFVRSCTRLIGQLGELCRRSTGRFGCDTRAVALIYVTAALPVIVGGALLAIDASRYFGLHTSLQKGTDALAIAGAAELDAIPSAIDRANHAVTTIVENSDVFSNGASEITMADVRVRYLSDIPENNADDITSVFVVSNDSNDLLT